MLFLTRTFVFSLTGGAGSHDTFFPKPTTAIMVLYLWGSSCGDGDVSPTHWLSLDRVHLHSAIPMFGKMLGFSNQIHSVTFLTLNLRAVFRLVGKKRIKGIRAGIFTNPQLRWSATRGWNLKSGYVSGEKKQILHTWSNAPYQVINSYSNNVCTFIFLRLYHNVLSSQFSFRLGTGINSPTVAHGWFWLTEYWKRGR